MSTNLIFKSRSLSFDEVSLYVEPLEKDPQKVPFVAWYVGEKLFYRSDACHCFEELEFFAKRTAGYKLSESGLELLSPEHLAPVFLMWQHRRFNVRLSDAAKPEVPMMDGSAIQFFCEMRKFCGAPEENLSFTMLPYMPSENWVAMPRSTAMSALRLRRPLKSNTCSTAIPPATVTT